MGTQVRSHRTPRKVRYGGTCSLYAKGLGEQGCPQMLASQFSHFREV